ncbi:helix-turn-helix domain-containing protein [Pigmentiphaga soli]|uniref:Helix-turn-helix domain-containing protein n=1 Tax=Pigmentiphaga soli TaxID=1007095 RepID=A0ABP8HSH0_9BURK
MMPISVAPMPAAAPPQREAVRHGSVNCSSCAMRNVCMPCGMSEEDFARLDELILTSRKVRRGEVLYRTGDPFQSIYAIKAGSFKTVVTLRDGREQITGFHIVGEPLGMDGICNEQHTCDAIALEDSVLCIIPFRVLESLCRELRPMQRHVHRLMSGEIIRESGLMMLLGSMCAEERVSAFLLNISQRLQARRFSGTEFNLRMTREEMGSFLGLKLETVSRMLSKFQKEKLIDVQGKLIRILDADGLRRV